MGIDQPKPEVTLQHTPDGHPIDARTLHGYLTYPVRNRQITQGIQVPGQYTCLELNFLAIPFVDTHKTLSL